MEFFWGTYRKTNDYRAVWSVLKDRSTGIDTAPNYGHGNAETFIGETQAIGSTKILTKVGYTGGDSGQLRSQALGARHCIETDYVKSRVSASVKTIQQNTASELLTPLECVFLHNPEHVLHEDQSDGIGRIVKALAILQEFVDEGKIRSYGLATWDLKPYGDTCDRIFDAIHAENLMKNFRYWMHPVNVLHMGAVNAARDGKLKLAELEVSLLASAPFAGGEAIRLLGPRFGKLFAGNDEPILQSLAIAKAALAVPVVGIRTASQAELFLNRMEDEIPSTDCAYHLANLLEK